MPLPVFHGIDYFYKRLLVLDGVSVEIEHSLQNSRGLPTSLRLPSHVVIVHNGVGYNVIQQTLDVIHYLGLVLRTSLTRTAIDI